MKQTALDWLEKFLKERYTLIDSEAIFQHAKEMEKEQIKEAYDEAYNDGYSDNGKSAEEYYKETYK